MSSTPDVDDLLVRCADEPIRIPGSIQPHGALLAATEHDLQVVVASANVEEHLGVPLREVLGASLPELLGEGWSAGSTGPDGPEAEPRRLVLTVDGGPRAVDALTHRVDGRVVVELEPCPTGAADPDVRVRTALRALQAAGTTEDLGRTLAREVRAVTGFDRVMVYRFDEHWHGTVVAEDADDDLGLDPYLGLRFPSTDIPAQARALYTTQWLRSIPDATYTPVPLVPPTDPVSGTPLDLSGAALRAVSPVHLEYLANMGVASSMSVSLITHGRLWGLVACHHYRGPHFPTAAQRAAVEFLGRTGSLLLEGEENRLRYLDTLAVGATTAELTRLITAHDDDPLTALTATPLLLELAEGSVGAAVRLDGRLGLVGRTPAPEDVTALLDRIWSGPGRSTVVTDCLARLLPDEPELTERVRAGASGLLAVPVLTGSPGDAVAWFAPEVLDEVRWAGDPHHKILEETAEGTVRLTPRASFATYVEQVRGTSASWNPVEVDAAGRVADTLGEILLHRSAQDARLAAALQQLVLTARPPTPGGYALSSRYRPSGADLVGGDWYDVTGLPDGRIVLMVGDVAGHGMGKAAITAQLRHALRAYLVDVGSAVSALEQLGAVVAALLPGELATVTAVELDPATGRLQVVSAGHPPPLLVRDSGAELLHGARGPALGIGVEGGHEVLTTVLGPGDSLLLYTDGLVEQRRRALSESLADLTDHAVSAHAMSAPSELEAFCDALLQQAPPTDDDVTLLALRRLP